MNKSNKFVEFCIILCFTCCFNSCFLVESPFDGDSHIKETFIDQNYVIFTDGVTTDILVPICNSNAKKVVISNIDSIGYNKKFIFGKTTTKYFIMEKANEEIITKYDNYKLFKKGLSKMNITQTNIWVPFQE